ncbi:Inner membrane protein ybaL [Myroides odoratus]|uniref:Inner membrane protein ybaL n=2 Tax=Myroides odoratus TaxID=256 RepID=A0A378RKV9_MYROD|nr:Inner membrane protein ybaL [Myroides odoratus]
MMSKYRNTLLYVSIIGGCTALIYWVVTQGSKLEVNTKAIVSDNTAWENFLQTLVHNLESPLALLLAQIVTIVLVARVFGWICKKIGQPSVIGEIIAGIALGPSLVGTYFPEFSAVMFPTQSLGNLSFLSQIGLILFMFVIGMELDLKILKNKAHDAVLISHASIVIPFALGMALAYYIFESFAPDGVDFLSFGLFLGISMSITAFPVLARIVQERGLQKTRIGTIVITCAAADDITAWCLLAAVIAIVQAGSFVSSLYIIALAIVYVIVMLKLVRPFLARIAKYQGNSKLLSKGTVAIFLLTLIISAYCTEVIGIHALFGAFMTGAIMPDNMKFRTIFIEKVEDVAVVLFLPLFFVYTGLRTEIGLLNEPYLWEITGLIILVATVGKFVGSAITAKFVGINWRDSLTIGALMNTRGLMELIVLNIGFDLGVMTGEVFAMMVIMALATTFMTGPLLDLIAKIFGPLGDEPQHKGVIIGKYQVFLFFENKLSLAPLMKLANAFTGKSSVDTRIIAMHMIDSQELNSFNTQDYEEEIFEAVQEQATEMDQEVQTYYKVSNDIESDVVGMVHQETCDLLLIEMGYSIYRGSVLGNILGFTTRIINPDVLLNKVTGREKLFENSWFNARTQQIMNRTKVPLGILINKDFQKLEHVFLPIFSKGDLKLLSYAQKMIRNNDVQVSILDATGELENHTEFKENIRLIEQYKPNHIRIVSNKVVSKEFIEEFDLMLITLDSWKKLIETRSIWLNHAPSMLLMQSL